MAMGMGEQSCSSNLSETRILERLFGHPQSLKDDKMFSTLQTVTFLNMGQRPSSEVLECLRMHFGSFQRVLQKTQEEDQQSNHLIEFEEGTMAASISLDASSERVLSLGIEFQSGTLPLHPHEAILKLREWPGKYHLLVVENDSVLAEHDSELPLAVGSTFKLFILSVLKQQIDRGERDWTDIVNLNPGWKSLPSGILQDWVDGSPLTLDTLASLMISISDNTAADHLLHIAGRELVEKLTERNRPFLSTRQLFIMKAPPNRQILDQYRNLKTEGERRKFLSDVVDQTPLPDVKVFSDWMDPVAIDVEWICTALELRDIMATVRSLLLMSINPFNAVDAKDWARIAYKGGSEPGVLSMTLWLESHNGKTFYVVLTANDEDAPVNEVAWILTVVRILEILKSL